MAISADSSLKGAIRETLADLAPFPGRAATAWRVAAVCALVAGIAMLFNIPESAISVYLVIFLMKADGAENTVVASAAIIAITLLVALMIPVLQWTIESAMIRILVMIVVSYVFIFIGAATKLAEGGSIVALIIVFILTLMNEVPVNGVISIALRYAWEMAILPMFVIAGFSLFFGRWSVSLLRQQLRERLVVARDSLLKRTTTYRPDIREQLEEGNDDAAKRAMLVKLLHQTSTDKTSRIVSDIPASYQLIYSVSALPETTAENTRQHYADQIERMIDALDKGAVLPAAVAPDDQAQPAQAKGILQALNTISGHEKTTYPKGTGDSFVAADAFSNPVYQRFALKTTLAAIFCYMFYAAIDWQGIHTAMVTCYVASMGTAGDTIHKLSLRITGCLVGAAIGMASIVYLMPHMESVGSLMLLVFAVALLAAWVTAGSEKISYAGVQIGLAFTLTVLQGFGPTTDFDTATDRIIGILVGNFAVYLVSTLIWPTPVSETIRKTLARATEKIAALAATPPSQRLNAVATIAEAEKLLGEVHYCLYLLPFEPAALRPDPAVKQAFQYYANRLATIGRDVYFSDTAMPEIVGRLKLLSERLRTFDVVGQGNPVESGEAQLERRIAVQVTDLETLVTGSTS